VAKSHNLYEAIFREPLSLFDHVVEHHGDLRHGPPTFTKPETESKETPRAMKAFGVHHRLSLPGLALHPSTKSSLEAAACARVSLRPVAFTEP
jgi:hypothetical protein